MTVLVAIGYTILAFISKKIRENSQLIMLIAFGLLMTAGLIDLVSYYIGSTGDEFIVAMESNSVMNLGKTYRECERRFC